MVCGGVRTHTGATLEKHIKKQKGKNNIKSLCEVLGPDKMPEQLQCKWALN